MSNFIPHIIYRPLNKIENVLCMVNEDDETDIKFTYSNQDGEKELNNVQTLAYVIQSIQKLNTNFEKIKKGYFIGTELLKNNGT